MNNEGQFYKQIEMINYLMQLPPEPTVWYGWVSFIVVLVLQEGYPWEITYTIWPVALALAGLVARCALFPTRRLNMAMVVRGAAAIVLGLYCFGRGLDEFTDYLRFWHGLWHIFIMTGVYYMFQVYERDTYELWEVGRLVRSIGRKKCDL